MASKHDLPSDCSESHLRQLEEFPPCSKLQFHHQAASTQPTNLTHNFTMGQFSQNRCSVLNITHDSSCSCSVEGPTFVRDNPTVCDPTCANFSYTCTGNAHNKRHHVSMSQCSLTYPNQSQSQSQSPVLTHTCECHTNPNQNQNVEADRLDISQSSENEPKICQIRKTIECHITNHSPPFDQSYRNRKANDQIDRDPRFSRAHVELSDGESRLVRKTVENTPENSLTIIQRNTDDGARKNTDNDIQNEVNDGRLNDYRKNLEDDVTDEDLGPPLPPRPPPRPRGSQGVPLEEGALNSVGHNTVRKYVLCCLLCGGLAAILGVLFLGVYFLLRSYTSTVGYFETVPTFVPATLLILTGVCVMSLARRRNRYSYLIKVSGACGLVCALTCALVTVTTTVLHMGRLQTLRECEYTQKTRTCTCYSVLIESHVEADEGVRFVFDSTPDCGVVHGALYSCLRGVFGLSVAGILVCVFCCMLVYQLLSHERKKMYWEQLELRCRSLYQQPGTAQGVPGGVMGGSVSTRVPPQQFCRCCEQCRYPSGPPGNIGVYPWDAIENRFWTPGQAGNFYSPNPGEEGSTGVARATAGRGRAPSGWSWPRLPWSRGDQRYRQTPSSPDSQYGFSNSQSGDSATGTAIGGGPGGYSVIGGPPYGPWGPPPPYSDPNSPARRGRYTHMHNHPQCSSTDPNLTQTASSSTAECTHNPGSDHRNVENFCQHRLQNSEPQNQRNKRQFKFMTKDNYENAQYDSTTFSDSQTSDSNNDAIRVNTLPVRKTKKRMDISSVKSVTAAQSSSGYRANVQNLFGSQNLSSKLEQDELPRPIPEHDYNEPVLKKCTDGNNGQSSGSRCLFIPKLEGVENVGFQNVENVKQFEPTESEVYFADVSSCCNISVKNDHFYEDCIHSNRIPDKNGKQVKDVIDDLNKALHNRNLNKISDSEDYLAKRFGKAEPSVRSRLPFPQANLDDINFNQNQHSLHHKESVNITPLSENTDFTDLSPVTPVFTTHGQFPQHGFSSSTNNEFMQKIYPSSQGNEYHVNNVKFKETRSRSTQDYINNPTTVLSLNHGMNVNQEATFLAPDAQYEVIKESNQHYTRGPDNQASSYDNANIGFMQSTQTNYNASSNATQVKQKSTPPKNLNITPIKRSNLGTNISSIIQNLGGNDIGLLYPDNSSKHDEQLDDLRDDNRNTQKCCYGDSNLNSGWQNVD